MLAEAAAPARRLRDGLGEVLIDFAALRSTRWRSRSPRRRTAAGRTPRCLRLPSELVARLPPRLATAIRTPAADPPRDRGRRRRALRRRDPRAAIRVLAPVRRGRPRAPRPADREALPDVAGGQRGRGAGAGPGELPRAPPRCRPCLPAQLTPGAEGVQGRLQPRPARPGARVRQGRCGTSRSATWSPATPARWSCDLKPVWLMSPLSVSDTLPLRTDAFDVVIFDEASQITLEEAVPSIFRAPQAIVVGDEMQLPPTDFFSARARPRGGRGTACCRGRARFEYDLSSNSFLNHAAKNLPSRMLGWHYRSRSRVADQLLQLGLLPGPAADGSGEPARLGGPGRDRGARARRRGRERREGPRSAHGVPPGRGGRLREPAQPGRGRIHRPPGAWASGRPGAAEHRDRGLLGGPAGRDRERAPGAGAAGPPVRRAAGGRAGARGGRAVRRAAGEEPRKHPGRRARRGHPERLLRPRRPTARCG